MCQQYAMSCDKCSYICIHVNLQSTHVIVVFQRLLKVVFTLIDDLLVTYERVCSVFRLYPGAFVAFHHIFSYFYSLCSLTGKAKPSSGPV